MKIVFLKFLYCLRWFYRFQFTSRQIKGPNKRSIAFALKEPGEQELLEKRGSKRIKSAGTADSDQMLTISLSANITANHLLVAAFLCRPAKLVISC